MKKIILAIILLIIVVSIYFVYNIVNQLQQRKKQEQIHYQKIKYIDTLNICTIKKNLPSLFIAFSPDCDHCQYEAREIYERQKDLKNVNIVFFTSAKDSTRKAFSQSYNLDTIENLQVISDNTGKLHKLLDIKVMPSIFIYNKEGNLLKEYIGETKIDAIIKTLHN